MAHSDPVADPDGVDLERNSARLAHCLLHHSAELLQVNMTGNDVHVRVAHRDERLLEVVAAPDLSGGAQQAAMRRALETLLDGVGAHQRSSVVDGGLNRIKK